ncbi:MAG: histidinol-phosphatase [Rhodopseudomonas palustris]|nr:histidinol-phosphatase [Rhodopseudomonas palustris]
MAGAARLIEHLAWALGWLYVLWLAGLFLLGRSLGRRVRYHAAILQPQGTSHDRPRPRSLPAGGPGRDDRRRARSRSTTSAGRSRSRTSASTAPMTRSPRRTAASRRSFAIACAPPSRTMASWARSRARKGRGDTYWVIDPIDGTRAFISGMPTWGTLLGLVADGRPVVGVMHQPFTGETWYAAAGRGARLRHGGRELPLSTRRAAVLGDAVLYSTHPSMFRDAALRTRYDGLAARCRLQRWGGDCYAFALVAQGGIDLMVDAQLAPYDILPLVPIIEEAGGVVTDLEGRTPLAGGTVVAAANAALHAEALALLTSGTAWAGP